MDVRMPSIATIFVTSFLFSVLVPVTSLADVDVNFHRRPWKRELRIGSKFHDRELRIATIVREPYTMVTLTPSGENEFTGFIPDLVFALSRRLGFNYKFYLNNEYGTYDDKTKTWSGMIGEVIKNMHDSTQGADMAAADITVTTKREAVVDFVKPFQHLGLTALMRRTAPGPHLSLVPYQFGIFQPLTASVWSLVILAAIVVGLFLWLMNLYNPYEWAAKYTTGLANQDQAESFNLVNSMWFVFTTLQWQGYSRSPSSLSGRFLAGIWFVFVTILLVTYTAGITNLLFWSTTVHRSGDDDGIPRSLEHLVSSGQYKIGAVMGTQTYFYLQNVAVGEEFEVIRNSWETPEGSKALVRNLTDGLKRVREDANYVLILDSMTAKYESNKRPCDVVGVGEPFALRSYGFALPNNSPMLEEMHAGVLKMSEEGEIEELESKWFRGEDQCWNATHDHRVITDIYRYLLVNRPKTVDLNLFYGAFVLLLIGAIISVMIGVGEVTYYNRWGRYQAGNQPQTGPVGYEPDEGNI